MAKQKVEKQGIEKTLEEIEKKFGIKSAEQGEIIVVSTGSIQLNRATGIGGTKLGTMVEMYGPESSGKSTVILEQLKEYQIAFPDKYVALFDFEHCYDARYSEEGIGVNPEKLLIYQPDNQEQGYDLLIELIEKEVISCAALDSQTAAIPMKILEGEMSDVTMGLAARNNSKFCGKVKALLDKHKVTLFVISQTRSNIGGMGSDVNVPTGGNSWKFYSDMRWRVWKLNDKVNELNKTTIDIIKNKCSKPFGQAVINILWGVGFDTDGELVDLMEEFNIIKKAGAGWYTLENGDKIQGKDKVIEFFNNDLEEKERIKQKILNLLKPQEIIETTENQ